jgi:cardiolipin synthase
VVRGGTAGGTPILTIPNLISILRLLLVPLFLWLVLVADEIAWAGVLLGFIGATDWIDGYIARRWNQTSKLGEFLDPLADRLAVASAIIAGLIHGEIFPAWFGWAIIVRELLIGVGALVIGWRAGTKLTVRWLGKAATLLLYFSISFFYVGVGADVDFLVWAAYLAGLPGLVLYYVTAFQYLGDARNVMADTEPQED